MSWQNLILGLQNQNEFKDFNPKKMSSKQLKKLRVDVNSGYRESVKPGFTRPSIGYRRAPQKTGKTNYSYYQNHPGWSAIADEIGIKKINSQNDISQMYDYTNNYRSSPPPAPPSYGNAPTSQGSSSVNFSAQLADIKKQNQAEIKALTKQLSDQRTDYALREEQANKRISSLSSTVANAQSMYDPTKGMGASNNINPALTIQEQGKKLSSGTQRYNRNKLSINNLNL
tara:strand:- start:5118 stop:5801 length:684 start_codon:yes stop_codon:yes gene_type:complete